MHNVQVKVSLPKNVFEFLSDFAKFNGKSVKELVEEEVAGFPESLLGSLPSTWFDIERIRERYGFVERKSEKDC